MVKKPDSARRPNAVDTHVGEQVRLRRRELGFSQERLADALGLTFQQVQKYERGSNRISASKLWDTAAFLEVPIQWFFRGLPDPDPSASADAPPQALPPVLGPQELELIAAFRRIAQPKARRRVLDLARELAGEKLGGASGG